MASSANSRPEPGSPAPREAGPDRLGAWLYRHRGATAVPFAAYAVWAARPTPLSIVAGLALAAAGEWLRVAALRHAGPHTRGRSLRAPHLATRGPYAWLRHPLYAGNALACAGLLLAARAGAPWFPALFALAFAGQYALFIRREERYLAATLGRSWREYAAAVPLIGRGRRLPAAATAGPAAPRWTLREALRLEFPTLRTLLILFVLIALRPWWPTTT